MRGLVVYLLSVFCHEQGRSKRHNRVLIVAPQMSKNVRNVLQV